MTNKLDWTTAWQLAGEICDIVGNTTAYQHEQIAALIQKRAGQTFNDMRQVWQGRCWVCGELKDEHAPGCDSRLYII